MARIRAKETRLLTNEDIRQLMNMESIDDCMGFVCDRWDCEPGEIEAVIEQRNIQMQEFIQEIAPNEKALDIFKVPNDYNNLKTSIRALLTQVDVSDLFLHFCTVDPSRINQAMKERNYELLPKHMQAAAMEARKTFLETTDAWLSDVIVDRAALMYMFREGQASAHEVVHRYTELFVAFTDIKIAVRSCSMGRNLDFIKRSLVSCDSLDVERLSCAAADCIDAICEYLNFTNYSAAIPYIKKSIASFERWSDDFAMMSIKAQKLNSFTVSPIFAYVYASLAEMQAIRTIMIAKQNGISTAITVERLREMYV